MRRSPTKKIEKHRVRRGQLGTTKDDGANGAFFIPYDGELLRVIASDGSDWNESGMLDGPAWEHVSVSLDHRCPTWDEMDFVKRIFWSDDETVAQLHVPRRCHINNHAYCLHLWKRHDAEFPIPPMLAVGIAGLEGLE